MPSEKKKILIVEDEEEIVEPLKKKLLDEGFLVYVANDGQEGLSKAKDEHPDLILLDITMPIMNGIEMLKILRDDGWGKSAKVIILTNLEFNIKASDAFKYGVYEYLVKSNWNLADIVGKIKSELNMY
jgi:DNA-binding response OmpR family regulator